ncbi:MAG TPA: M20/M25/M40 family metallo-hydrolase [Dehalococcoidia bacterium]|nr:M20/M25/M40 family metallo-hydrolase [Dehalococcoidia bacterium]
MISRERALGTLLELIAMDSPSGQEDAIAAEIERRLRALGAETQQDAYGNVIGRLAGRGAPLLLSAHMDTVQPGIGIKPIVNGDEIHTDGSTILAGDPKAGVTAILEGITSLHERNAAPRALEVVITRGEEQGLVGSKNLDYGLVTAHEGFVFDGEGPVNKVTVAAPSQYSVEAAIIGRAAHAGVEPEKGIPAIRIAAELILAMPQGRLDPETTANIGMISGGTARNAVPERCTFRGEFRSRNRARLQELRAEFERVTEDARRRHPEATIDVQLVDLYEGYRVDEGEPLLGFAHKVLAQIGKEPVLVESGGGTDANNFAKHGIRALVVGLGGESFHTVRERLFIPNLIDAARFCEAALTTE